MEGIGKGQRKIKWDKTEKEREEKEEERQREIEQGIGQTETLVARRSRTKSC